MIEQESDLKKLPSSKFFYFKVEKDNQTWKLIKYKRGHDDALFEIHCKKCDAITAKIYYQAFQEGDGSEVWDEFNRLENKLFEETARNHCKQKERQTLKEIYSK